MIRTPLWLYKLQDRHRRRKLWRKWKREGMRVSWADVRKHSWHLLRCTDYAWEDTKRTYDADYLRRLKSKLNEQNSHE